jgi:hypothetical protein
LGGAERGEPGDKILAGKPAAQQLGEKRVAIRDIIRFELRQEFLSKPRTVLRGERRLPASLKSNIHTF